VVKLYVEGGGDSAALKVECRSGFANFLARAGLRRKPRIVACGSRRNAYESFCTAVANGESALLLVDSEAPVSARHQQGSPDTWIPWQHLKERAGDGWDRPSNAKEADCHLMVQCMEAWLLADREVLKAFFGQGCKESSLPAPSGSVEAITKVQLYKSLADATRDCRTKGQYGKGEHSFRLLSLADATKVTSASPWANRFVEELKKRMDA
jgi:hypothetical protein